MNMFILYQIYLHDVYKSRKTITQTDEGEQSSSTAYKRVNHLLISFIFLMLWNHLTEQWFL